MKTLFCFASALACGNILTVALTHRTPTRTCIVAIRGALKGTRRVAWTIASTLVQCEHTLKRMCRKSPCWAARAVSR